MEEKIWDVEEARRLTWWELQYLPHEEFQTLPQDVKDRYFREMARMGGLSLEEYDQEMADAFARDDTGLKARVDKACGAKVQEILESRKGLDAVLAGIEEEFLRRSRIYQSASVAYATADPGFKAQIRDAWEARMRKSLEDLERYYADTDRFDPKRRTT